jgi:S-adenosylmethionine:tRNA ribosyltransferase-isomerase
MRLSDFDYYLPKRLIAQSAVRPKSFSRLLVVKGLKLEHKRFYDIKGYLKKGDVLVINESKVSKAKLLGNKISGSKVEIILMKRLNSKSFKCRIKGKKLRIGTLIKISNLICRITDIKEDVFTIEFERDVKDLELKAIAILPTPPYIKSKVADKDYQTIYSKDEGSLAAPTAGLHWTANLLRDIKKRGIDIVGIKLHVGFGTFLPVKTEDFTEHKMEEEYVVVDDDAVRRINNRKGRLFVVGTTTLKALETASQSGQLKTFSGYSNLFIYPGYRFRTDIDGFITNFHLPKSTLLLLVSALAGKEVVLNAYREAVKQGYRFFSLGDASLFLF